MNSFEQFFASLPVDQKNGCRRYGPREEDKDFMDGSEPPRGSEIYVVKIPKDFSHRELIKICFYAGNSSLYDVRIMMNMLMENKGYAFVRYFSPEMAARAISYIHGKKLGRNQGHLVAVFSFDQRTLVLSGVSPTIKREEVEEVFRHLCGDELVSVTVATQVGRASSIYHLLFASNRSAALAKKGKWRQRIPPTWGSWVNLSWQQSEVNEQCMERIVFLRTMQPNPPPGFPALSSNLGVLNSVSSSTNIGTSLSPSRALRELTWNEASNSVSSNTSAYTRVLTVSGDAINGSSVSLRPENSSLNNRELQTSSFSLLCSEAPETKPYEYRNFQPSLYEAAAKLSQINPPCSGLARKGPSTSTSNFGTQFPCEPMLDEALNALTFNPNPYIPVVGLAINGPSISTSNFETQFQCEPMFDEASNASTSNLNPNISVSGLARKGPSTSTSNFGTQFPCEPMLDEASNASTFNLNPNVPVSGLVRKGPSTSTSNFGTQFPCEPMLDEASNASTFNLDPNVPVSGLVRKGPSTSTSNFGTQFPCEPMLDEAANASSFNLKPNFYLLPTSVLAVSGNPRTVQSGSSLNTKECDSTGGNSKFHLLAENNQMEWNKENSSSNYQRSSFEPLGNMGGASHLLGHGKEENGGQSTASSIQPQLSLEPTASENEILPQNDQKAENTMEEDVFLLPPWARPIRGRGNKDQIDHSDYKSMRF